jgi:hypothetical protein
MLIRKSGPRRSRCFDVRGLPAGLAGGSIVMLVAMPEELGDIVPVPESLAVIALIFGIVVWVRLTPAERLWARVCLRACGPLASRCSRRLSVPAVHDVRRIRHAGRQSRQTRWRASKTIGALFP